MNIDTNVLVPITEANQNFSKVVRLVDENGMAIIMKNNKPRYMMLSFQEYDDIQTARHRKLIMDTADSFINENDDLVNRYLLEPDTTKTPILGRLNGLIHIPDNFDEPLEEMKEYMF